MSNEIEALEQVGDITAEFIDKMLDNLGDDQSDLGLTAKNFLESKKDVLIGIAGTELADALRSIAVAGGDRGEMLTAKRKYINTLSMTNVVRVHRMSVEELEASAEAPLRLAGIFETLIEKVADAAPKLLGLALAAAGIAA